MSFLGRLKSIWVEKVMEDEFSQPLTEHQVYAIVNRAKPKGPQMLRSVNSNPIHSQLHALEIAASVALHTPELEFRLLGTDPSIEAISAKVGELKGKLEAVDGYLLQHYTEYMEKVGLSVSGFEEGRQFYATRKKVGEARFLLEKMVRLLSKSKAIARLNITIKNLRNTLKLVEKVPNIKKMGLVELKAIDLARLERTNQEVAVIYGAPLTCLTNLSKYITKVNLQSFTFIINNLKMCLDSFDVRTYQQIIRSYMIINPPAALEQLLITLLLDRIRMLEGRDINDLASLSGRLVALIINLHKIIKWHIINRALKNLPNRNNTDNEEEESNHRRLSVSSNNSEEAPSNIQLADIVYISVQDIKQSFSKTVDSTLADLVSDSILSGEEMELKQLYQILQVLGRIGEICRNFTGRKLDKVRKVLIEHFNRRESNIFTKAGRDFTLTIEQERGDWNRLAFPNNFRFAPIDRLLYRWKRMQQIEDHRNVARCLNRLLTEEEEDPLGDDGPDDETLQLKVVRMESLQRLEKRFEEWSPKDYLQLYQGDSIVCQSSYKLLGVLEKYTEFLMYAPSCRHTVYIEHMLFLLQYMIYFIFTSLLSAKYRCLFFQPTLPETPLEKAYTLKRFRSLYPHLSAFVTNFRTSLQQPESPQLARLLASFRKEIKEASGEDNQLLRAKVVAIQACKYCLAYLHQILKGSPIWDSAGGRDLANKIVSVRSTLQDLCVLLLTESSQSIVGVELQTIRSLFQSIRWYETYEDLREYVQKIVGIVKDALERLKGSHRGEIPMPTLCYVFVFVWRTVLTFSVKLFLQGKGNNRRDNKLNFEKFIDDLFLAFDSNSFPALPAAYTVFKSIFRILLSAGWEQCKQLLVETLRKFDYIYPILMSLLENSEHMGTLAEREKEGRRAEIRSEIEVLLKETK